ncbi:winged helix-turn-helix transcriptional regulator [Methanomicrobium antiquum]
MFVYPVCANPFSYSVNGWDEAPPVSEPKAPVPAEFLEIPPLAILFVSLALISPAFLLAAEIFFAGFGLTALNFRRIDKKSILNNNFRNEIYVYIVQNPGAYFTEIENALQINRGTLNYHIRILKQEHLIVSLLKNGRNFYFENSGCYTHSEMVIIVSLKSETSYTICEYLLKTPGASRNDIAEKVQTTCSTVSWHMGRLSVAGVLLSTKCGRVASYRLSPSAVKMMDKLTTESFSAYANDMYACRQTVCQYDLGRAKSSSK